MNGRDIRIARELVRIAKLLVGFDKQPFSSVAWGDKGGLYFRRKGIICFPSSSEWIVLKLKKPNVGRKTMNDDESKKGLNLVNHNSIDEDSILLDYKDFIEWDKKFSTKQDAFGFLLKKCGIDEMELKSFNYEGMEVHGHTYEMSVDDMKEVIDMAVGSMNQAIGFDKMKKYYPSILEFQDDESDNDEIKFSPCGQNIRGRHVLLKSSESKEDMCIILIHEISHSILSRNKKVDEIVTRMFKHYVSRNMNYISFEKGDVIEFEDFTCEALTDYKPSFEYDGYEAQKKAKLKIIDGRNAGDEITYFDVCNRPIKNIRRKHGNRTKSIVNRLGIWSYGLTNVEEFMAVLVEKYCAHQLSSRLSHFFKHDVIPNL